MCCSPGSFSSDPGFGYHVDQTKNIATGNDPESIYAVMSGKNYNGGCCFDYGSVLATNTTMVTPPNPPASLRTPVGNSETDDNDDGCGTMEAIYFGNAHWAGNTGAGSTGPWAGADLEQGGFDYKGVLQILCGDIASSPFNESSRTFIKKGCITVGLPCFLYKDGDFRVTEITSTIIIAMWI